jgi:hypothetical protein
MVEPGVHLCRQVKLSAFPKLLEPPCKSLLLIYNLIDRILLLFGLTADEMHDFLLILAELIPKESLDSPRGLVGFDLGGVLVHDLLHLGFEMLDD